MSNHRFIQVEPPKEELTLPANIVDFEITVTTKTAELLSLTFVSTVTTFTGILAGDKIQLSYKDDTTLVEYFLGTVEVFNVVSVNEIETTDIDTSIEFNQNLVQNILSFRGNTVPKLYKLPTNNFSLQLKSDNIVRYYEDPVDKTIMYIDVLESPSICGHGTGACQHVWGHDRTSLGIVTLNNTDKIPMHNIVPYLNSIFLGSDDEN